ncbi:MAG: sulfotransferase [Planctomycetota bacterium]
MTAKLTKQQIMQRVRRADAHARRGDLRSAAIDLHPIMDQAQDMPDVVLFWANIRAKQGHYMEAAESFRALLKKHHGNAQLRQSLALCLRRAGKYDEALQQIARIRESDPWNIPAVLAEVDTYATLGRRDEAFALLDDLDANTDHGSAAPEDLARIKIISLRMRNNASEAPPAIELAKDASLAPNTRSSLAQHAGIALQKAGQHDEAWRAMADAKTYRQLRFSADEHETRVTRCIEFWQSDEAADLPTSAEDGSKLIFIVGMPRSGTSLLEQMLGRLPGVAPMGERSEILRAAGAFWSPARPDLPALVASGERMTQKNMDMLMPDVVSTLRAAAAEHVEGEPVRMIDKQVFNFMHLPLIARMLPGAKVLHIRRHPCDTAVSCFSQWFNREHHFLKDEASLGAYYKQYLRLIDAWRELPAPAQRPEMMDVHYEALASAPEQTMRPILDFLGLDWDDAVLSPEQSDRIVRTASRDQVREAINTAAVGRWKDYEQELEPFIEALGRDIVDAYDPAAAP